MDITSVADSRDSDTDQTYFGRLLQYSPFASDLAFSSDRAYLIGDEVSSREKALKTLVVAHDEACGEVAKYFMIICGWIPPRIKSFAILPPKKQNLDHTSDKTDSMEKANISAENARKCEAGCLVDELHHLPAINVGVICPYQEKAVPDVVQEKTHSLPKISCNLPLETFGITPINSPSVSLLTANKSCTLPSICTSAGVIRSCAKKPSLMLCLRCGVTIDCSQAQLEGSVDQKQLVVEWETVTTRDKEKASKKRIEIKNSNRRHSQRCHHTWEVSNMGLAFPLPTTATIKEKARERPSRSARAGRHPSSVDTHRDISLERKTKSLTAFQSRNVSEDRYSTPPHTKSQPNIRIKLRPLICKTSVKVVEQVSAYTHQNRKSLAKENPAETVSRYTRESPKIVVKMSKMKKDNASPQAISCERSATQESLSPINVSQRVFKAKPDTCFNDSKLRYTQKVSVTSHKPRPSISPHQRSPKQQVPLRQQAPLRQQTPQTTLTARHMDKDKPRALDPLVAGWNLPTFGQATEDEQDLMEKRTWSQPVIPPPFPTNPLPPKNSQKLLKNLQLSKTLAQHKRNLNQISKSYVSPYWAKKELKNARNRSPASDSGDDRSSLSRITTISGMSSSSSEGNTEGESSTDESQSDSGSSTSGSDFFTRYANKGGPTSVDDIFKRTLPRQKLQYSLNRIKEEKEKAEREQLGYLRGREGATPPPRDHGDNVKDVERGVTFSVSEYDMCSDAEEIKELWKLCFPEVDFWDRKRRKQFKKTKILS